MGGILEIGSATSKTSGCEARREHTTPRDAAITPTKRDQKSMEQLRFANISQSSKADRTNKIGLLLKFPFDKNKSKRCFRKIS